MPKTNEIKNSERNYGIDLLRIVSMMMVISLHLLGHGGAFRSLVPFSLNYHAGLILQTLTYGAINCYAITTGYFMIIGNIRYHKLLELWFEVFFWSVVLFFVPNLIAGNSLNSGNLLRTFLPLLTREYWYFSAYFGLFLLIPFFNKGIIALGKNGMKKLLLTLFIMFAVITNTLRMDPFRVNEGYSFVWLCVMYVTGAYIRLYLEPDKIKHPLRIFFFTCLINWLIELGIEKIVNIVTGGPKGGVGGWMLTYMSPTVLIGFTCLFIFFSRLNITNKELIALIKFFAPLTFGVYLIHENPTISSIFIYDKFEYLGFLNTIQFLMIFILAVIVIFLTSAILEYLRKMLFKLFRIDRACIKISNKTVSSLKKIIVV